MPAHTTPATQVLLKVSVIIVLLKLFFLGGSGGVEKAIFKKRTDVRKIDEDCFKSALAKLAFV